MDLLEKYDNNLTTQDYSQDEGIEGVQIIPIKRFNDESGSLTELVRLNQGKAENIPDFQLKQINFSVLDGKMIKAFHVHKKQTDIWFVPPNNKVLLLLADLRKDSPTAENHMRIILGDGNSRLVTIPPGIAHGCKNLAQESAEIIYLVNNKFDPDPDNCDELRLPWDIFGKDVWSVSKE